MVQERSMEGLSESSTYCATWALVRIIPRGSMKTPEPEIGRSDPPRGWQRMLTSAARVSMLISSNDLEASVYGFSRRGTCCGDVVADITASELVFFVTELVVGRDVVVVADTRGELVARGFFWENAAAETRETLLFVGVAEGVS